MLSLLKEPEPTTLVTFPLVPLAVTVTLFVIDPPVDPHEITISWTDLSHTQLNTTLAYVPVSSNVPEELHLSIVKFVILGGI